MACSAAIAGVLFGAACETLGAVIMIATASATAFAFGTTLLCAAPASASMHWR